ncbi:hypothetical protein FPSE5266_07859 [Fusarium pseudograminearum]|nr:hypothetical protein FPSE5266_07859 [Fusarium pseudograminearum]
MPASTTWFELIGEAFSSYNRFLPLFEEEEFMREFQLKYSSSNSMDAASWACLNVVLSIAYRLRAIHKSDSTLENNLAFVHIQNALNVVSDLLVCDQSLSAVRALAGMACVLQGTSNPEPAAMLIAAALRLAHAMNMHRESSNVGLTESQAEKRRRLFWMVYILDKDISLRMERPFGQDNDDMDVLLPSDGNLEPSRQGLFNLRIGLAIIQGQVYKELYSTRAIQKTNTQRAAAAQNLSSLLSYWKSNAEMQLPEDHSISLEPGVPGETVHWVPGASQCGTCLESGQECRFDNDIRFKHSHSKTEKQSRGEWAKVPSKISFTAPRGIDGMVLEEPGSNSTEDKAAKRLSETLQTPGEMIEVSTDDLIQSESQVAPLDQEPDYRVSVSNFIANSTVHDSDGPSDYATAQYLPVPVHIASPYELTEREAFLFMIYIYKCAPLSDACDDARHFELEVPRLALRQPMIMNGLLALASRYDSRCMDTSNDIESTFYHNKCIKLLIKAFAQPPETWDSTLLTAVVIARLYEENENETDSYYHHLSGTQNLLNHEAIARPFPTLYFIASVPVVAMQYYFAAKAVSYLHHCKNLQQLNSYGRPDFEVF